MEYSVLFTNLANAPGIEKIIIPKLNLITAEYLSYEREVHVLVIMTDISSYISSYANGVREVLIKEEISGPFEYLGYIYKDLSTI